jgi:hypothetical protein
MIFFRNRKFVGTIIGLEIYFWNWCMWWWMILFPKNIRRIIPFQKYDVTNVEKYSHRLKQMWRNILSLLVFLV